MKTSINLKRKGDSGDSNGKGEKTLSKSTTFRKIMPSTKHATSTSVPSTKHATSTPAPSTKHATLTPAQIMPPQPSHPKPSTSQQQLNTEAPLSLKLPSLSSLRLFSQSHSETREPMLPSSSSSKNRAKLASNEVQRALNGFYFCANILESPNIGHHLKKTLNPLISLKTINNHKDISNPHLFRGCTHGDHVCSFGWQPH